MGEVIDVNFFSMKSKENRILKVKIRLDVTKSLRRSLRIAGPNKMIIELSIKHEKIGCFCNYCRHLGHEVRSCEIFLEDSMTRDVMEERRKNWLKTE
ncbi:hypothetical protein AHAS_Ahas04G0039000 [Arachis hypogaea]